MDLYFKVTATMPKLMKAQRAAIFLHVAGQEAMNIFNTFQQTAEQCKDYGLIVQKFEEHCSLKQNKMYRLNVFKMPQQLKDEPFEHFQEILR